MTTSEQHMPTPAELYADLERIAANTTTWNRLMTTKAKIAQTPKELIWTLNKAKLYRYIPVVPAEQRHRVPLLLVFALINRPYVLDLRPGHSFVDICSSTATTSTCSIGVCQGLRISTPHSTTMCWSTYRARSASSKRRQEARDSAYSAGVSAR